MRREYVRRLQEISKKCQHLNHRVPDREEEEQEVKNLFEKIMKENFTNLVKEIDI